MRSEPMTTPSLVCWKCGASLATEPLPLARGAECPSCNADLHVCRLCKFYDPAVARSCREPVAEEVHNKERANFCGYFQPRPQAFTTQDPQAGQDARDALDTLFGDDSDERHATSAGNDADAARQQLENLFGPDKE
ncbi:MAG: hypothetical protein JSU75_08385 [Gammaproteobacteria bacterium]|nr:MAG: hypothetical protein JSU75_08385 [Gammaproteobacteria bacterium]